MGRRHRGVSQDSSTQSDFSTEDVAALQDELRQCQALNEHLSNQLQACQALDIRMQGYLFKFKTYNVGLFSPWTRRYFTLCGSTLKYFKTDRDTALQPRGEIELMGNQIEWEGLEQGRYWTFMVVDSADCCLIRLGSENRAVVEKWVDALELTTTMQRARTSPHIQPATPDGKEHTPVLPLSGRRPHRYGSLGSVHELDRASSSPLHRWRRDGSDATSELTTLSFNSGRQGSDPDDAEEDSQDDKLKKAHGPMLGSTPFHRDIRASILASEQLPLHPHPGLVNLGAVVLVATNFRLILENMFKYGVLFNPLRWIQQIIDGSFTALILCWPVLAACTCASLFVEKWAADKVTEEMKRRRGAQKKEKALKRSGSSKGKRNAGATEKHPDDPNLTDLPRIHWIALLLQVLTCTVCFLVPSAIIFRTDSGGILPKFVLTIATMATVMKLISYAHCNRDLRIARCNEELRPGERGSANPIEGADQPLRYPENLTVRNVLYFMLAPTLAYQISFPRTKRVRIKWLLRRIVELLVAVSFFAAIVDQYIQPSVVNSMRSMRDLQWASLLERVLKLSVPVVYAWLCFFYIIFHLWLNILAEALRFGDREFYKDWWNATNLGDYWRQWNLPVHKWMLRTIYAPAMRTGCGRSVATFIVFFVSAVAHELAVAIPLKMFKTIPWSFMGIMLQVPMIFLTQAIQNNLGDRWGNITFWVAFCIVGQPICLLNYYYDWLRFNNAAALKVA